MTWKKAKETSESWSTDLGHGYRGHHPRRNLRQGLMLTPIGSDERNGQPTLVEALPPIISFQHSSRPSQISQNSKKWQTPSAQDSPILWDLWISNNWNATLVYKKKLKGGKAVDSQRNCQGHSQYFKNMEHSTKPSQIVNIKKSGNHHLFSLRGFPEHMELMNY